MAQAYRKSAKTSVVSTHVTRGVREGALFIFGAISIYLLIALLTYDSADPGWSNSGTNKEVLNSGGVAGAWFADITLFLFGVMAYLFPVMVGYLGWILYRGRGQQGGIDGRQLTVRFVGFLLTVGAGAGLAYLHFAQGELPLDAGGILGKIIGSGLESTFSFLGATLFLVALFLTGITLFTSLSWFRLMDVTGQLTLQFLEWCREQWYWLLDNVQGWRARRQRQDSVKKEKKKTEKRRPPRIEPIVKAIEFSERAEKERQSEMFEPANKGRGLPALALLDGVETSKHAISASALEAMSRQLELKLADFGIEVEVVAVNPGPVITRFELQPAAGVKVSQISNLAKDLARALSAISVRVVEVIPGKNTIGLEVPNEHRELVRLSEILKSKEYERTSSPLTLGLGKDIGGHPVVTDLARMPHLLVAGTTGSGKSVAVNAMVLSLLYKAPPEDVRMIMIDPKMLELSVYEGIPHLLAPVVTDMKKAANALRWCVAEMERRYQLMAALGVRNITGYNRKVKDASDKGEPILDPLYQGIEPTEAPQLENLPYIVVIIDELADMMMIVGKKVEELITRLAQKARAAGIHLILATQRPSVDVITGLIKANIPTRIAFQVSSKIDSRTILDQMGAEQLLGHGDMLYLPPGTAVPTRVHGAFVDDHEVHRVAKELKKKQKPVYIDEIIDGMPEGEAMLPSEAGESAEYDPFYDEAVRFVTESRRASISYVQRRLKVGYNRAARMVEEMERSGVVGPLQSNGTREVLAPPPVTVD